MPVSRHTGLAIRRFRPLSHLSGVIFGKSPSEGRADEPNIVGKVRKSKVSSAALAVRLPGPPLLLRRLGFVKVDSSVAVGIEASKHRKRAKKLA
jgi:hypothetical protein